MTEYSIDNNQFQITNDYLTYGAYGLGVYYSQINTTTLFTIDEHGEYINVYDLTSIGTVIAGSASSVLRKIPKSVNYTSCLASSTTPSPRLYIVGGDRPTRLQIFDIEFDEWNQGDKMDYQRWNHGCIVVNDTLWAMGYVAEIETIDITDVYNAQWSVHNDLSFDDNRTQFGLVAMSDIIYVVGGFIGDYDSGYSVNTVYIIDTVSSSITTDVLPFGEGVFGLSMIVVDGTVYGFGGLNDTVFWLTYNELNDTTSTSTTTTITTNENDKDLASTTMDVVVTEQVTESSISGTSEIAENAENGNNESNNKSDDSKSMYISGLESV